MGARGSLGAPQSSRDPAVISGSRGLLAFRDLAGIPRSPWHPATFLGSHPVPLVLHQLSGACSGTPACGIAGLTFGVSNAHLILSAAAAVSLRARTPARCSGRALSGCERALASLLKEQKSLEHVENRHQRNSWSHRDRTPEGLQSSKCPKSARFKFGVQNTFGARPCFAVWVICSVPDSGSYFPLASWGLFNKLASKCWRNVHWDIAGVTFAQAVRAAGGSGASTNPRILCPASSSWFLIP